MLLEIRQTLQATQDWARRCETLQNSWQFCNSTKVLSAPEAAPALFSGLVDKRGRVKIIPPLHPSSGSINPASLFLVEFTRVLTRVSTVSSSGYGLKQAAASSGVPVSHLSCNKGPWSHLDFPGRRECSPSS